MTSTFAVLTDIFEGRWRAKQHAVEVHHLAHLVKRYPAPCNDPPCMLRAGLFIGSSETETNLAALRAVGITHILQAGAELAPSHAEQFIYKKLQLSDEEGEDLISASNEACDFINEGRQLGEQQHNVSTAASSVSTVCEAAECRREHGHSGHVP
eukprot:GHRQ01035548.1.p1 GENE.GHRQ01035548.1~~GHRQ01035548.1.p1  ORF type:complete len:154 (-),score=23.02 GHRQ01035548.1:156-617(-)